MRTLRARTEHEAVAEAAALGATIFAKGGVVHDAELVEIYRKAKYHAGQRAIPWCLDITTLRTLYAASGGRCAVSGLPFDQRRAAPGKKRPFAVSIDRVNCALGYEPANVRLVCALVNVAMGEWGEDALVRVATALLLRRR